MCVSVHERGKKARNGKNETKKLLENERRKLGSRDEGEESIEARYSGRPQQLYNNKCETFGRIGWLVRPPACQPV